MKKIILSACILMAVNSRAQVIIDTVSTGAGYANQIWYSLQNDEVGTQSKDNWDLGIELSGFNSSILVNTAKSGSAVYQTPFTWSQWSKFDTAGYKSWTPLHNSDTMWDIGALNKTGIYNSEDLGWGTYDMNTHVIGGTRLFLMTLTGNKFIKLGVKSLASGVYTITYMNTDGSDSTTFTVKKTDYPNKNFVYYNFTTKALVDREPATKTWDLTFTRYIYNNYPNGSGGFVQQLVSGVLQNKTVKVAEVRNVNDSTFKDYTGKTFTSRISEIGSDWKVFDLNSFSYKVTDSLVYFVQDIDKNFWKVVFTGFASATGDYIFTKEKLQKLSVASFNTDNRVYVYPNPAASGNTVSIITDFKGDLGTSKLSIMDINGKVVFENNHPALDGFGAYQIPFNFDKGVYFISIQTAQGTMTQKLLSF
jgi:hypothetical protein